MDRISRTELDTILQARLASEPEFRARLLEDPRGTLADIVGFAIPDAIAVTVHEESASDIHLVIPSVEDLLETDLELVSGGGFSWTVNNSGPGCGCI